jgi:transcriptional regulator with XRE-family HTH domain
MKLRFTCWKEIAEYFGKDVRTVQRWESQLQMPIHRPLPNIVIALPRELDLWINSMPFNNRCSRKNNSLKVLSTQLSEPLSASNNLAYCAFDREFRYLHASERACSLMERDLKDLVGKTVWKAHPGFEYSGLGRQFVNSLRAKKVKPIRIDYYHEPVERHFRNIVVASKDGIETFWRDVTAEKTVPISNSPLTSCYLGGN